MLSHSRAGASPRCSRGGAGSGPFRFIPLLAWEVSLLGALWFLGVASLPISAARPGTLAASGISSLEEQLGRGPVPASFAALRAACCLVCLWLAVVGLVALVLQGTGMLRSAAAIEVLMPGLLRRILAAALGASLGTGAITIAAANASALRSPPPVLRAISDTPSPAKAPSSSQPPKLFAAKEKAQQEAGQEAAAPSTPRRGSTWTVREGDNFWAIAAQVLAKADGGTQPSDARIEAYWWRLVKANEARLVDPGVPDLIFAGQVMSLPPLQA